MKGRTMEDAGFFVYVNEADMRTTLEKSYPGIKEVAGQLTEDLNFEHETNGEPDFGFYAWKYTHPSNPELWIVSKYVVTTDNTDA